jgi:hypothetical protein
METMDQNYTHSHVKMTGSAVENPSDVTTIVLYVMLMLVIAIRNPNPDAN